MKKRVQAGWNGWRRMSGVICHRRVPARVKGKVYRVAVRPAMLYGLETVALTKRQEAEMELAELKMLRFSLGVTIMDKIRNEYIRGTAQVGRFGEKTREARLRWYGHVLRKDDGYIGRNMLRMELPGKRKRGRPKRRFIDVVKEDMAEVEVTKEDTEDMSNWRWKIRCGDPRWEKAERRRRFNLHPRFSASAMFAYSHMPSLDAIRRKYMYRFIQRLNRTNNSILLCFMSSTNMLTSYIWKQWYRCLYVLAVRLLANAS